MSEHIGFRCPDDLIEAIKQQVEATGKSRTEVLIEMLRSASPVQVQAMPSTSDIDDRFAELEQRLLARIEALEGKREGKLPA